VPPEFFVLTKKGQQRSCPFAVVGVLTNDHNFDVGHNLPKADKTGKNDM
jgi:hypothetical protein